MNAEGYVDIQLLASFNRVKALTTDINLIRESLQESQILEVKDDKVRKKEGWETWVLPAAKQQQPQQPSTVAEAVKANLSTANSPVQPTLASLARPAVASPSTATTTKRQTNGVNPGANGERRSSKAQPKEDEDDLFEFEDDWVDGSRPNTVKKYYLSDEDSEFEDEDDDLEIDEDTVARIMIVTQRKRDKTHASFDRAKMNDEILEMINEGLYQYETGLRETDHGYNNRKVGTIDQEQFSQLSASAKQRESSELLGNNIATKSITAKP